MPQRRLDVRLSENTCASLELPPLTVPDRARLAYGTLERGTDGVVVELSLDDGVTWRDLPPDGGDPGSFPLTQSPRINVCGDSSTQGAFTGDNGGFPTNGSDLSAYAGYRVRLRRRLPTNPAVEFDGFDLDQIRIRSPGGSLPADLMLRANFDIDDAAEPGPHASQRRTRSAQCQPLLASEALLPTAAPIASPTRWYRSVPNRHLTECPWRW